MAEQKSLWERFSEGVKRVWTFPDRLKEKTDTKIQEAVHKPSKINERVEDAKFSEQFPYPYGIFLHAFQPDNEKEKAIFEYMKGQIKEGNLTLEAFSSDFAKIGNGTVLFDLWINHQDSQDAGIRKLIVENPRCPVEALADAKSDRDWEVRRAVVMRPDIPVNDLVFLAQRETNPFVLKALQERLGDRFPQAEQFYAATQAQALTQDGKAVAVNGPSIPVYYLPKDASIIAREINDFFGRYPFPTSIDPLKNLIAERGNTVSAFSDRTLHQRLLVIADTKMLDALYNYYTPTEDKYMLREIAWNPRSSEDVRMHFNSLPWARNDPARPRPGLSSLINAAAIQGATQLNRSRDPNHISKPSVDLGR